MRAHLHELWGTCTRFGTGKGISPSLGMGISETRYRISIGMSPGPHGHRIEWGIEKPFSSQSGPTPRLLAEVGGAR